MGHVIPFPQFKDNSKTQKMNTLKGGKRIFQCCLFFAVTLVLLYVHFSLKLKYDNLLLAHQSLLARYMECNYERTKMHETFKTSPPNRTYEMSRRRLDSTVLELWNYLNTELNYLQSSLLSKNAELAKTIKNTLDASHDIKRSIIHDLWGIRQHDGYERWRMEEMDELEKMFQKRLLKLQNPKNCTAARKLVCDYHACGLGCQVHTLSLCLLVGYASGRMVVLPPKKFNYNVSWEEFFRPLSENCSMYAPIPKEEWTKDSAVKVVNYPFSCKDTSYRPLSVPSDLAERLSRIHAHPAEWMLGQLARFVLRLQPKLEKFLENEFKRHNFVNPIIGVHVRRQDKTIEVPNTPLSSYMNIVQEMFTHLELRQEIKKKRVFLATDDISVIHEAKKNYLDFEFITNDNATHDSNQPTKGAYSEHALYSAISDIFRLAHSDFVVCTLSSNLCRLVYEMIATRDPDGGAHRVRSLDLTHFFCFRCPDWEGKAVIAHVPKRPGEIELQVGDRVTFKTDAFATMNQHNGFSSGKNMKTGSAGIYPTYKVNEVVLQFQHTWKDD